MSFRVGFMRAAALQPPAATLRASRRIDTLFRFPDLCRIGVGGGDGSSNAQAIVLSSDDDDDDGAGDDGAGDNADGGGAQAAAEASTEIPASELTRALSVKQSGIVDGQPGLFSTAAIPANSFVCIYAYDRVLTDEEVYELSTAERDAAARYAVMGPAADKTLIIDLPITDRALHVAAFANEPLQGGAANLALHAERVTISNGSVYFVVALYTCDAPVSAGTELTWNYGSSYASVRSSEGYAAGLACTSKEPLEPPLETVVERILDTRGAAVAGILYKMDSVSSSQSDDSSYSEELRAPERRRVQPRRAARS